MDEFVLFFIKTYNFEIELRPIWFTLISLKTFYALDRLIVSALRHTDITCKHYETKRSAMCHWRYWCNSEIRLLLKHIINISSQKSNTNKATWTYTALTTNYSSSMFIMWKIILVVMIWKINSSFNLIIDQIEPDADPDKNRTHFLRITCSSTKQQATRIFASRSTQQDHLKTI